MALSKKYAGLPDLDAAPEIYETPELTDDASTAPTNTLRTDSPTPSDDGNHESFDKTNFDRDAARRKFEPSVVDARQTNLSDTVGGNRKGYKASHRRRRRGKRLEDGENQYGYLSDESDEEETLNRKLARLRREAEEVRIELARREQEAGDSDIQETRERQSTGDAEYEALTNGMVELHKVLADLKVPSRDATSATLEQEFSRQLAPELSNKQIEARQTPLNDSALPSNSANGNAISAVSAFADRLSALESALGVTQSMPADGPSPILSQLDILTVQIDRLSSTLTPRTSTFDNTSNGSSNSREVDILTSRLRSLQSETDHLVSTRKTALETLKLLHENHLRGDAATSQVFAKYLSKRDARRAAYERTSRELHADDRPESGDSNQQRDDKATTQRDKDGEKQKQVDLHDAESQIFTDVFLDEQASKINALYNILPSIEQLQPLLPVVLERLRGLSVIHTSAAHARKDMDGLEERLTEWEKEMAKWRHAVEGVEKGIEEAKAVMKENVDVVSEMVHGVESRLDDLEK